MDLDDFELRLGRIAQPCDIWTLVRRLFRQLGFPRIGYRHLPPFGAPDADIVRYRIEGVQQDLLEVYFEQQLYRYDPVAIAAQKEAEPFYWKDVIGDLTPGQGPEMALALRHAAAALNGVTIPVFGPNGRNGYFGIELPPGTERLPDTLIKDFQWICQSAHLRYCTLLLPTLGPTPELSQREREVLSWVARGKSNPSIGAILGISAHTVDAHLRRIYSKLGVFDRITATVRGLGIGIINAET